LGTRVTNHVMRGLELSVLPLWGGEWDWRLNYSPLADD